MLFFHISTPFNFLFLFVYLSSFYLTHFFLSHFRLPIFTRDEVLHASCDLDELSDQIDHDVGFFGDHGYAENEDLVADIVLGGRALLFQPYTSSRRSASFHLFEEDEHHQEEIEEVAKAPFREPISSSEYISLSADDDEDDSQDLDTPPSAAHVDRNPSDHLSTSLHSVPKQPFHELELARDTPPAKNIESRVDNDEQVQKEKTKHHCNEEGGDNDVSQDERFVMSIPKRENAKLRVHDEDRNLGGSYMVGSTSNSSYEWRSSMTYRGSETDQDPFSSSSRRSSSKWENYTTTVFQKYDEEMMSFDGVSAQKLTETESLKSVHIEPRSLSQRIVHKLSSESEGQNKARRRPHEELEAAYVAQICLTWEALNWNYKKFWRSKASKGEGEDSGCKAHTAQQFQQFQVLLQRFIENEPYEHGQRPEIYARMRISSPKLLQVPEFQESEDEGGKEESDAKISSTEFLMILEYAIRTFMNFLKADKRSCCQILQDFFKKNKSCVDPTLFHLIKKANQKKKAKLTEVLHRTKCFKKRKLKEEEEMEILMGLIDLKIVSRVLRMSHLSYEQLHWCEEKMSNVRVLEGSRVQRNSTPLFFPSH